MVAEQKIQRREAAERQKQAALASQERKKKSEAKRADCNDGNLTNLSSSRMAGVQ
jgi:hypothetical protein